MWEEVECTVGDLGEEQREVERRRRRSLLRIVHARGAIPNEEEEFIQNRTHARGAIPDEVGPARCRATPALNQSADETRTPASTCLPAVPFRGYTHALRQRVPTTPPLNLESWPCRRRGSPSGQVTVDRVERLSRVLGHYS